MTFLSILVLCNDAVTTVFALSANAFVIFLCFKAKMSEIIKARVFIAWRASADLAMALIFTILQLGLTVNQSYLTVLIYGPATQYPICIIQCLCALLLFLFNLDLVSLPLAIIYRYGVICKRGRIQLLFTRRNLPLLVIGFVVVAASFAGMIQSFFTYSVDSEVTYTPLQFMGAPIEVQLKDIGFIPATIYCSFLCISTAISYCIMIYSARKIFMELHSAILSPQTRKLQREMTICMLLQALLPLIFSTLPMLAFIILLIAPTQINFYGTIILALLNWQPCIYPLIALISIRPFRQQLTKLWKRKAVLVIPVIHSTIFTTKDAQISLVNK